MSNSPKVGLILPEPKPGTEFNLNPTKPFPEGNIAFFDLKVSFPHLYLRFREFIFHGQNPVWWLTSQVVSPDLLWVSEVTFASFKKNIISFNDERHLTNYSWIKHRW